MLFLTGQGGRLFPHLIGGEVTRINESKKTPSQKRYTDRVLCSIFFRDGARSPKADTQDQLALRLSSRWTGSTSNNLGMLFSRDVKIVSKRNQLSRSKP